MTPLRAALLGLLIAGPTALCAEENHRTIIVRERAVASLLDGGYQFKLLKIKGYSVEIKAAGEKLVLQVGQSFSPLDAECQVVFEEIATETRIARFRTDCL